MSYNETQSKMVTLTHKVYESKCVSSDVRNSKCQKRHVSETLHVYER